MFGGQTVQQKLAGLQDRLARDQMAQQGSQFDQSHAFQREQFGESKRQWGEEFTLRKALAEAQMGQWDQQFKEGVRQFDLQFGQRQHEFGKTFGLQAWQAKESMAQGWKQILGDSFNPQHWRTPSF